MRTRDAYPEEYAQTLNNLAGAELNCGAEFTEEAIQHLQQALEVRSRQAYPGEWAETSNNLAIAYTDRTQGERRENVAKAIQHYQQALEVYTPTAFPDRCLKAARALGNLAFENRQWTIAWKSYEAAFQAQNILMQASFSRAVKQIELGEIQNLHPRAAYACVQAGELRRAVEILERGRAQLLRESLERRRQDLAQLRDMGFGHLYDEYMQALDQYNAIQAAGMLAGRIQDGWISRMDQALKQVQAAEFAIREQAGASHPQYKYFLQALPFEEIAKQAQEKPLVYLSATSAGGTALIVSGQHVQALELPALNQESLQAQIWSPTDEEVERINQHLTEKWINDEDIKAVRDGYFSMYALWSMTPHLMKKTPREIIHVLSKAWYKTLDQTTYWLWGSAMNPVVNTLKEHNGSAVLIPLGQLALLPLHAAWTEDPVTPTHRRYAMDQTNFTYAPSAHALWQANLAAKRPAKTLLAVDNPDGSLRFSEAEVQAALGMFEHSIHLRRADAKLETVKRKCRQQTWYIFPHTVVPAGTRRNRPA